MFGSSRIIGLDIGDASIEAVFVDLSGRQPVWLSRARAELPAGLIERGIIRDVKAAAEIIRGMLAAAEPRPITGKDVIVNVPDQQAVSRLLSLAEPVPRERILQVVSKDAEGFVPYSLEDVRLDYALTGASGSRKDIFYAAAPEAVLMNIEAACLAAGLAPVAFDLETLALARLFADPPADSPSTAHGAGAHLLLDIGAETTTLSIIDAEGLRRTAVIDFGGAHLTRALAAKEKLPADKAEALKRKAGYSPDVAGGRIFFVLQKETQALLAEIRRSVDEYERSVGAKVAQMTVAGGTALTPQVVEYLGASVGLPARLGDPVSLGIVGVPEAVPQQDAVLFANALGLAFSARDGRLPRLSFQRKERMIRAQPAPIPSAVRTKAAAAKRTRLLIAIVAALIGLAAVGGTLYWAFVLRPAQQGGTAAELPETLTLSFGTTLGFDPAALPEGAIAATELRADEEARQDVAVTGATETADFAHGTVTLVNDSDTAQPLVERTRLLSTGGVIFRLSDAVTVPARGRVDAAVVADQSGASGNIGPSRFTIPGLPAERQAEVYGSSAADMTGGVRVSGEITDADIQQAVALAREALATKAMAHWNAALVPGNVLVSEPLTLLITRSAIPEPGAVAAAPAVEIAATVIGGSVSEESLRPGADAAAVTESGSEDAAGSYAYSAWQIVLVSYDAAKKTAEVTVRFAADRH